jgi:hypothetical protein
MDAVLKLRFYFKEKIEIRRKNVVVESPQLLAQILRSICSVSGHNSPKFLSLLSIRRSGLARSSLQTIIPVRNFRVWKLRASRFI